MELFWMTRPAVVLRKMASLGFDPPRAFMIRLTMEVEVPATVKRGRLLDAPLPERVTRLTPLPLVGPVMDVLVGRVRGALLSEMVCALANAVESNEILPAP